MFINIDEFQVNLARELGRGAFGTVYLCHDTNMQRIAGKKINGPMTKSIENLQQIKEIVTKKSDMENHQNILCVRKIVRNEDSIWIFMPFCELGNLNDYFINNYNDISVITKISFMQQITSGLLFLHGEKIVHRDVKPANILVSNSQQAGEHILKLCDFDLSKCIGSPDGVSVMTSNVGTAAFMAPEFWRAMAGEHLEYTKNVDVFACGLVFLSMLQAQPDSFLQPTIEDESATEEEQGQHIGLAMRIRQYNLHDPFLVTTQRLQDNIYVRKIKELISQMTHVDSLQRPDMDKVHEGVKMCYQRLTGSEGNCASCDDMSIGHRVTKFSCRDLRALHVSDKGDILLVAEGAVQKYTLDGCLKHQWKVNINEPTGITTLTIQATDYIAISMIINEGGQDTMAESHDVQSGIPPSDTIQIQIRNTNDNASEAEFWGHISYSAGGECGLGKNLALLESGRLILAVKSSDENPCVIHLLNCSATTFQCLMQIKTDSFHPPAICGLKLSTGSVIVVADVWNSKEECSIAAYDEETGKIKWQMNEERLKESFKREKFMVASICSASQNRLWVSETNGHLIFEVIILHNDFKVRELMNCWDQQIWSPSCMAWHVLSNCIAVSHKNDNALESISDREHCVSVYTAF